MKFHVFTTNGDFCIEADDYRSAEGFVEFYNVTGEGSETTFPSRWRRLLFGEQPTHRRVEENETVEFVLGSTITRLRFLKPTPAPSAPMGEE